MFSQIEEEKPDALSTMKKTSSLVCRICKGDHFTLKCPYKDTIGALSDLTLDEAPKAENPAAESESSRTAGGKYVPPSMRGGGERKGESMSRDKGIFFFFSIPLTPRLVFSDPYLISQRISRPSRCQTSRRTPRKRMCRSSSGCLALCIVFFWPRTSTRRSQRALPTCRSTTGLMLRRHLRS